LTLNPLLDQAGKRGGGEFCCAALKNNRTGIGGGIEIKKHHGKPKDKSVTDGELHFGSRKELSTIRSTVTFRHLDKRITTEQLNKKKKAERVCKKGRGLIVLISKKKSGGCKEKR